MPRVEHCDRQPLRTRRKVLRSPVFDNRVHTDVSYGETDRELRQWSELPASLRSLIDDEEIHQAASAYGYDLSSTPGVLSNDTFGNSSESRLVSIVEISPGRRRDDHRRRKRDRPRAPSGLPQEDGASVVALNRCRARSGCGATAGDCSTILGDVRWNVDVPSAVEAAMKRFGRIDVLVDDADGSRRGETDHATDFFVGRADRGEPRRRGDLHAHCLLRPMKSQG